MRPSKVYIKIFISFLIVLIITEIAIFGFFILFAGRKYRDYFDESNAAKFKMAMEMVEYHSPKNENVSELEQAEFQEYIHHIGLAFKTIIWITGQDGEVLYKSFERRIPEERVKKFLDRRDKYHEENGRLFSNRDHFVRYRSAKITLPNHNHAEFHMLFGDKPPFRHGDGFALGLFGIGVIVALLTFPISRLISKPIKSLIQSATRLSQGDLSHRSSVKSQDEIGELAKAFNTMAEKIESMVKGGKELTAQVSHELRSPLARIQIAVEILKDRLSDSDDEDLGAHLKEIQVDVEELDLLIGRILELSKLDLQQETTYTEVFSPGKLMDEFLSKFDSTIEGKKIQHVWQIESDAKIIGNREAFKTAICNLLDNAVRYTPVSGKMRVIVKDDEASLKLSFINSCDQLSDVELDKLFEPFFRLDPANSNGSGLGLAITKKVIEKHKGKITAKNSKAGLEFELDLPTVKVD